MMPLYLAAIIFTQPIIGLHEHWPGHLPGTIFVEAFSPINNPAKNAAPFAQLPNYG